MSALLKMKIEGEDVDDRRLIDDGGDVAATMGSTATTRDIGVGGEGGGRRSAGSAAAKTRRDVATGDWR